MTTTSPSPNSPIPHRPPVWADVFGEDDAGLFAECEVKGVRFVWRWIVPGSFRMGSPRHEAGRWDEEGPQHTVAITRGFWLGETPVTQAQWEAVTGENPSQFKGTLRPVESIDWHAGVAFASRLNERLPGLHAALPTEAQWEYACRAGSTEAFHDDSPCTQPEGWDPALEPLGWYERNSGVETHDVKLKAPNAWGLYDMHGNVWEWCRDVWTNTAYLRRVHGVEDPLETDLDSAPRVGRGGSWVSRARYCRAACRFWREPDYRYGYLGLRLSAGQELQSGAAEPPEERSDVPERRSRG